MTRNSGYFSLGRIDKGRMFCALTQKNATGLLKMTQ